MRQENRREYIITLSRDFCFRLKGRRVPWWLSSKESTCNAGEMCVQSLGQEDPLKNEMATHCNILTWRIPWTEEPGGLQSMESQRVRQDSATSTSCTRIIYLNTTSVLWNVFGKTLTLAKSRLADNERHDCW